MSMLIAGCYERFLFGFKHDDLAGKSQGDEVALDKAFSYPAHQNVVKCLTAAGRYMVSGGADDQMHLYDLVSGKDLSFLMNPGDGAVTCVHLFAPLGTPHPTNLLSGSQDGQIHIWKASCDPCRMIPLCTPIRPSRCNLPG